MLGRSLPENISLKQFGMCSRADKNDEAVLAFIYNFVSQQEVAADMTFTMAVPIAGQRMIKPFGAKRRIIGDQQQHGFLELVHIVPPCPHQPLPILEKRFGIVRRARQRRALTGGCFFRGHQIDRRQR